MVFAGSGEAGAEPERSGWSIGGGIGLNWTDQIEQEGWNRDTNCYPDSCDNPGPPPGIPGYRWMYDLDVDAGSAFAISVGRMFDRWRLEVSAAQRSNSLERKFKSINELDGRPTIQRSPGKKESHRTWALGWESRLSRPPASLFPLITGVR